MPTLIDLKRKLLSGKLFARDLVDESLARIEAPDGEGARCFLTVYAKRARKEAELVDEARKSGVALPPFAGIPVAIKDLFDVAGEVTRAASRVTEGEPPALADADAVAALRRSGFIIVGKTNMTEFAYSGLGLNAHFPAPLSPFEREIGRIPGGSTSGGAVAVADGMVPVALGTDTGGSCRVPAAFSGVVGFKPTSERVSRRGAMPLSGLLDSIGPLADSVSCCAVIDSVLAGGVGADEESFPDSGLRLGVIEGYVDEGLDEIVAADYAAALTRLSRRGVRLHPVQIPELIELQAINRKGGLTGAEAYAFHRLWLATRGDLYDPWVRARLEAGGAQSASDYIDLLHARRRMREAVERRSYVFDALVMPSVPIVAPPVASLGDLDASRAINVKILRNTGIANFLDRPAISIPCHVPGSAPVGFMLMGETGEDRRLLSIARGLEYAVRRNP